MRKDRDKKEEVEYKNKSGTAWSHSYLNQKPWHPLSYPNQRRKWIAEQTHSEHQRKSEEVAREFAQEQEFFRTSAMLSKKEREKLEVMQAVSFMYMRPPGYNAESARAAEIAEEKKVVEDDSEVKVAAAEDTKKRRVKDLYGRTIPTEEEFPVLKNAPRLESGATARVKPFAVEIRNVKCARCGAFGHQSGDRECPLKDSITTNDEARQKRDDPLTSIMSAMSDEPLKWELKHKPGGLSPPRGGFRKDDPNQQIIPEDIYDEYGGFLACGGEVQELLASFPNMKQKKKKHKKRKVKNESSSSEGPTDSDEEREHRRRRKRKKHKEKKKKEVENSMSESSSESDGKREHRKKRRKHREKKKMKESSSQSDSGSGSEQDRRHERKRNYKETKRREKAGKESKELRKARN